MMKKYRSILYISLTLTVIVSLMICFFISNFNNRKNINENKLKNGLIVTYYSSQHVCIKNILPLSDELGTSLNNKSVEKNGYGYIRFSIKNNNKKASNYRIYIKKNDVSSKIIADKYIKFCLTNEYNKSYDGYDKSNIPSYSDLLALSSKPLGRLIYSGRIDGESEKVFILRSWLSDEYEIKEDEELFDFDIFVESK